VSAPADDVQVRHEQLVESLIAGGHLCSLACQGAFRRVRRDLFVPGYLRDNWDWVDGSDPGHHDEWLDAVFSDSALYILRDRQDPLHQSTSSMPSIVAEMLEALDLHAGDRVLEIGTGSGYNAALLCELAGAENVTTIDCDEELVARARDRLRQGGYTPTVAVGDGFHGYAANAPYDRVIATCAVRQVPGAWIVQTRPGGRVLAMLPHGMAQLTVGDDGSATGRFHRTPFDFMPMQRHWSPIPSDATLVELVSGGGGSSRPLEDGRVFEEPAGCAFFLLHRLAAWRYVERVSVRPRVEAFVDLADSSWALIHYAEATVTQGGPRRLWDITEALYEEWCELGRPDRDRFGLTVPADGPQEVWLDEPGSEHRWPVLG
jgi:protein-L-isoaspartate(D-aspartate) O-methyltransferase